MAHNDLIQHLPLYFLNHVVLVGGIFYVGVSNSRYLSQIVGNLFDGLDVGVINIVVVLIYEGNSGQTLLLP